MFQTICDLIPVDPDASARARRLGIMRRVLDGTLYDVLPFEFHDERTGAGEYIPLRRRRPSVRYALARIVVEDSVALLFSEGHFPAIASPDAGAQGVLARVAAGLPAEPGDGGGGGAGEHRECRDPAADPAGAGCSSMCWTRSG